MVLSLLQKVLDIQLIVFYIHEISFFSSRKNLVYKKFFLIKKNQFTINNIIIFIGNFNGFDKAFNAAEIDLCWNEVKKEPNIISALKGFNSHENQIFIYTDFGLVINYYLRKISSCFRCLLTLD